MIQATDLAVFSCIAKASAAENDRDADPNYPEAYSAKRTDRYTAWIRSLYVPSHAVDVNCTGSPYDPNNPRIWSFSRKTWKVLPNIIAKSQSIQLFRNSSLTVCLQTWTQISWFQSSSEQLALLGYTTNRIHSDSQTHLRSTTNYLQLLSRLRTL